MLKALEDAAGRAFYDFITRPSAIAVDWDGGHFEIPKLKRG